VGDFGYTSYHGYAHMSSKKDYGLVKVWPFTHILYPQTYTHV